MRLLTWCSNGHVSPKCIYYPRTHPHNAICQEGNGQSRGFCSAPVWELKVRDIDFAAALLDLWTVVHNISVTKIRPVKRRIK